MFMMLYAVALEEMPGKFTLNIFNGSIFMQMPDIMTERQGPGFLPRL
jgi:hypothetical protein